MARWRERRKGFEGAEEEDLFLPPWRFLEKYPASVPALEESMEQTDRESVEVVARRKVSQSRDRRAEPIMRWLLAVVVVVEGVEWWWWSPFVSLGWLLLKRDT